MDPGIENGTVESEAGALSDRSNILLTQYVQLLETRRSYQKIMIETVFIYLALTGVTITVTLATEGPRIDLRDLACVGIEFRSAALTFVNWFQPSSFVFWGGLFSILIGAGGSVGMFIGRRELSKGASILTEISDELEISDLDSDVLKWVPWVIFCCYLFLIALWAILFAALSPPMPAS